VKVDGRNAHLPADRGGDVVVGQDAELDETRPEPSPMLALVLERLLELDGRDALFAQEQVAEPNGHE
jgi:hypothetical protein